LMRMLLMMLKQISLKMYSYIYVTEGKYKEGVSVNQKRVIRKKAVNFRIVNGEMMTTMGHSYLPP